MEIHRGKRKIGSAGGSSRGRAKQTSKNLATLKMKTGDPQTDEQKSLMSKSRRLYSSNSSRERHRDHRGTEQQHA
jgi:hypothetical protein